MLATVDSAGRIMLPKPYREALRLESGTKVEITPYGAGLALVPERRRARIVRDEQGRLVADSDTVVTDEMIEALRDAGRR
ncbi:MAG: AbrB/MazE/SpoVT family DNA-binding domain-containing protein [Micrococcales bacterium]|nr:AbrB/MazE/SpoVT family DNA-binding domain-containing protein [Micrococcales bacterium]